MAPLAFEHISTISVPFQHQMYRRARPFDLATHPFDLPQMLIYLETKDFR